MPEAGFKVEISFTSTKFLQSLLDFEIGQNVIEHLGTVNYQNLPGITLNAIICFQIRSSEECIQESMFQGPDLINPFLKYHAPSTPLAWGGVFKARIQQMAALKHLRS